ncbi:hypothetical protein Emed_003839 [Eimeria media]
MTLASVFAGSKKNNAVSFCALICLAVCLASEAPRGWGATTRAGPSRGIRSFTDNGVHASSRQPPVSEMFFDFGRITGVSSLSTSKAVEDLHRALDAAPNRLTVDLPYSGEFASAFMEYKDTGICKAWTDDRTGRISTGMHDAELYMAVEDRPREMRTDIDAIKEAADNGDIGKVISLVLRSMRGPLPVISFFIGGVLLVLWLFFFSWQACIRGCRKVCCYCMRIKRRAVTGCSLCLATVVGVGLCAAAVAFVGFSAASVQNSLNAIGSSACAAMEMIQAAEWGTPTSDGKIETTYLLPGLMEDNVGAASFVGVRGMVENLNGISALFSEDFEDNVVNLVKRFFSDSREIDDRVAAVKRGGTALRENVEVFRTQAAAKGMKSLFVSELDRINYQYETPVVLAYDTYKKTLTQAFDSVSLADIGFDQAVDISDLEEGASHLHQFGADVARIATPFASVAPLLLKVETGFILSGVVLGLIALAFFLLSKGKSSTCVSAFTWNYLLVIMSLAFITTGLLFFASSASTQLCDAGVKSIWELRSPADTTGGQDTVDGGSTNSSALVDAASVLAECMHNPNFNFLEAQGLSEEIEDAKDTIRMAENTVLNQLQSIPPIPAIADARTVQDWVKDFGVMVIFDQSLLQADSQMQGLVDTFPEMLQSGIQDKTKTVTLGDGKTQQVYGMQKVLELISPAGIDGYKQATSGNIQVSAKYPTADDQKFQDWLDEQKKNKKDSLMNNDSKTDADAESAATDYAKKLKNAVLLTVLKLQLLDGKMPCYRPTASGVIADQCTGRQLFGRSNPEWNLIAKSTWELAFAATGLEEAMSTQYTEGRKYVQELFFLLEQFIDNIAAAYNCSFVRQNMLEALYLACNEGADHVWGATVARFIGLVLGVVLAFFIFFIWRVQRDNKDCRSTTVPAGETRANQGKNGAGKREAITEEKSPTDGGKEVAVEAPTPV